MGKHFKWVLLFLPMVSFCGCATLEWQPQWPQAGAINSAAASSVPMAEARKCFNEADTADRLRASIRAHEKVLDLDPGNYEALYLLGNQYILLGTAYTTSRSKKQAYFNAAMKYCEWAMYTNPDFRRKVDSGLKPWEATDVLTQREVDAMLFWVTALQYRFKEVMRLGSKIANVDWMDHCLRFLDRIESVRPDYGGGAVEFAKTICYYALPQHKGGDRKIGNVYMARAVEKNPDWLLGRWARGKYFHKINGNDQARKRDLTWVANTPLDEVKDPYPWRVHFQQDARAILGMD
jgi:hypothetical protein